MLLTRKNEITVLKMIPCQPKSPQTTKKEHLNNNDANDNLKHPGCYVITDYFKPFGGNRTTEAGEIRLAVY